MSFLSKNVNRRWSGEECKRGQSLGQRRRNQRLNDRYNRSDVHRDRLFGHLRGHMSRNAKGAVGVGEVSLRVNVDRLDRSAGNDQRDAQQCED
jgi:hypothetical protein